MHSTTKYIGGHGTSIGGIIVDGGNFDWEKHADRFPMLNKPDPSYHGAVWTQAVKPLGPIAYIIKARVTLLRDIGAAMSPFNAFMFIQGLETVALRMRQHCSNATAVAQYLSKHPKVTKTIFPGLMTGEPKRRADAYLKGGYGGLVGFELKGGRDAGRKFIDSLKMFYHVANIGDARSLAIHPASTTHSQLTPEEQRRPASPTATCGCRSASSTSTTSSPISIRRPPAPRPGACPHSCAFAPGKISRIVAQRVLAVAADGEGRIEHKARLRGGPRLV